MKKYALIFAGVTMVSLVIAAIGHAVNPAFCMAVKPMSWPFIALAAMLAHKAFIAHRKEK